MIPNHPPLWFWLFWLVHFMGLVLIEVERKPLPRGIPVREDGRTVARIEVTK